MGEIRDYYDDLTFEYLLHFRCLFIANRWIDFEQREKIKDYLNRKGFNIRDKDFISNWEKL